MRGDDEDMPSDFRTATVARVGRSYPRLRPEPEDVGQSSIGGYKVAAALIGLLSALGLLGWLLAR